MTKHPGETLNTGFLKPLGLNANRLALSIGVNRSTVGRILAGEQRITPDLAARLGAYFGVPPLWWLRMQADYDAASVEGTAAEIKPLALDSDVLLTPRGVMRLLSPTQDGANEDAGGQVSSDGDREPRQVQFENGAVALIADTA